MDGKQRIMSDTIAIFGDACTDVFIYGVCNRLCPEAPVPILLPQNTEQNDGMALNVANNIRSLGCSCISVTNKKDAIVKQRFVESSINQMLLRMDSEKKVDPLKPKDIPTDALNCKYSVVSDYDKGFITQECARIIASKFPISFLDSKKTLGEWAHKFTYIKINEVEYKKTLNTLTPELKSKLIITLGKNGCMFREKIYTPPTVVNTVNVCGAGDTFLAGLVVEYSRSNDIIKAINYALLCSSDVVQNKGVSVPFARSKK